MAINTFTTVVISGAASATLATAKTNFNAAMVTLYANVGPIYNASQPPPVIQSSGCAVAPDAAVANDTYLFWAIVNYYSGT